MPPRRRPAQRVRLAEVYVTEALDRVDAPPEGAGPGDIIAVAGIPEIMIGDTLADPATRGPCRASPSTIRASA